MLEYTRFIALSASQPSGDYVVRRFIAVVRPDLFECFSRGIELTKTQRGRDKVQLAIQIVRPKARDLSAPSDCFEEVLLLGRFGQKVKCRKGIGMKLKNFLRV